MSTKLKIATEDSGLVDKGDLVLTVNGEFVASWDKRILPEHYITNVEQIVFMAFEAGKVARSKEMEWSDPGGYPD